MKTTLAGIVAGVVVAFAVSTTAIGEAVRKHGIEKEGERLVQLYSNRTMLYLLGGLTVAGALVGGAVGYQVEREEERARRRQSGQ